MSRSRKLKKCVSCGNIWRPTSDNPRCTNCGRNPDVRGPGNGWKKGKKYEIAYVCVYCGNMYAYRVVKSVCPNSAPPDGPHELIDRP